MSELERRIKGGASDLKEFFDRLATMTGVPAADAERLLLTLLGDLVRNSYQVEVEAAARAAEAEVGRAAKLRGARARNDLRRRGPP